MTDDACERIQRLIALDPAGKELSAVQKKEINTHLSACDRCPLEMQLMSFMDIDNHPGPPSFMASPFAREQWIANTIDAALVEIGQRVEQVMHIAPPQKRSKVKGLASMAMGCGIAAGLAIVVGTLIWPTRSLKNADTNLEQGPAAVVTPVPSPSETSSDNLSLVVVITDQGFYFRANPDHGLHGLKGAVYTTNPEIPKRDNDWDFAELKKRLLELKIPHSKKTSITLGAENHIPYGILIKTVRYFRDNLGDPLFPDVALVRGFSDPIELLSPVDIHYPGHRQPESELSVEDLNLTVAITGKGFHFKISPNFRLPWMTLFPGEPDIPKMNDDWNFYAFRKRLRELKENHSQETSIILGAEEGIPYEVLLKTIDHSLGTTARPLFPDITLTRLALAE